MWTSKRVNEPCPRCAGVLNLTLAMYAKDPTTYSLAGVQMKFAVEVAPKLYCTGMYDPPLGEPMWEACGYEQRGRVDNGDAVFDRV